VSHPVHTAEQVLARLSGLPGGPELLAQARRREDVALVGGAVRDLLLGHWPRELDVTVARDAPGLARELAASISPGERAYGRTLEPVLHERFGTASVAWQYGRIDIAERRAEDYAAPGALPDVRAGSFEEDLRRRDFTINAIALPLHGAENEGLVSVEGALEDLRAGRLRVLHDRSFIDDPTRILRLARYAARLGFEIEHHTRRLAERAVADGAMDTVSGTRVGAELWLLARAENGRAALATLSELGVLQALGMPAFDAALAAEAAAYLPSDGRHDLLLMAVAFHPPAAADDGVGALAAEALAVMQRLDFPREDRERILVSAINSRAREMTEGPSPAVAARLLDGLPVEGAALTGALAARESAEAAQLVRAWLEEQRHVTLEIDGNDLLVAGVPEGPEVGRRLVVALMRKREGAASGREEELRAALDAELEPPGTPLEPQP